MKKMSKSFSKEERLEAFWVKVNKHSGIYPSKVAVKEWPEIKDTECWLWIASKDDRGYGYFGVGKGKILKAHRFSYKLKHGKLSKKKPCVCHKCDKESCVRPLHLFAGTDEDNMYDRDKKGRQSKGEKHSLACKRNQPDRRGELHGKAKLTEKKVLQIRDKAAKHSNVDLAQMYNVTAATIGHVVNRQTWDHI
jgi:hypothetical protein